MKTVKYKKTVYTLQQLHMQNTVQPASYRRLQCDKQSAISPQSCKFNVVTINSPAVHILKRRLQYGAYNMSEYSTRRHSYNHDDSAIRFITMIRNYKMS